MKKFLFLALFLTATFAFGQTLGILYENKVVNTGDTIEINLLTTSPEMELDFDVFNKIDSAVNVMAARENIDVVKGSSNYFCFGNCFDDATDTCLFALELAALDTLEGELAVHFSPKGNAGTSLIKYSAYIENNLNDITYFYVRYTATVGVKNNEMANVSLNAFPNPASENVTVSYQLPENNSSATYFVIKNLVGKTVYSSEVSRSNDRMIVNLSDLSAGIYFYSLEQNSKSLITKKLIVK